MSADAAVLVVPDSATVAFAAMAFVAATLLYNGAFWRVSVQWSKSLTYGMAWTNLYLRLHTIFGLKSMVKSGLEIFILKTFYLWN